MGLIARVLGKLGIKVAGVRGDRAWSFCPFHRDEHPTNFFVRVAGERAGQWHCFACKGGGSLAELVERVRGCDRDQAREWVAALRQGDDVEGHVPEVEGVRIVVEPVGQRAFRLPREVVLRPLGAWSDTARRYAERRHLTARQVERWGLGYAVVGRLAGRLVIPVRYASGEAVSYMARSFAGHESKYYYPMEREHADLDCMFGEQHWPAHPKRHEVVLCEGALNALAVERACPGRFVAALGGSDPRPIHVLKLAGFRRVVVLMDDDPAGEGAAGVLRDQLVRHVALSRVNLGAGRDADDVPAEELRDAVCEQGTGR